MPGPYQEEAVLKLANELGVPAWEALLNAGMPIPLEHYPSFDHSGKEELVQRLIRGLIKSLVTVDLAQKAYQKLKRLDLQDHWIYMFENELKKPASGSSYFDYWYENQRLVPEGRIYQDAYILFLIRMAPSLIRLVTVEGHAFYHEDGTTRSALDQKLVQLVEATSTIEELDEFHAPLPSDLEELLAAREKTLLRERWDDCQVIDSVVSFMDFLRDRLVEESLLREYEELYDSFVETAIQGAESFTAVMHLLQYCKPESPEIFLAITRMFDTADTESRMEDTFGACVFGGMKYFFSAGAMDEERFERALGRWILVTGDENDHQGIQRKIVLLFDDPASRWRQIAIAYIMEFELELPH
jgi:hypothetical protein